MIRIFLFSLFLIGGQQVFSQTCCSGGVPLSNNNTFFFPTPKDDRLPLKDRVHASINDDLAMVYQFSDFQTSNVIKDTFMNKNYLIVGNANFMASFDLDDAQSILEFEYIHGGASDAVLQDNQGTQYNIFGEAISGSGGPLKPSESFMGYWFSIPAFYTTEVYANGN